MKVTIFVVQVLAVAAIAYFAYAMDAFDRHYFPKEPASLRLHVESAALVSLVWLAPPVFAWLWKRLKNTA